MNKKLLIMAGVAICLIIATVLLSCSVFPEKMAALGLAWERGKAGLELKKIKAGNHLITYLEGGQGETIVMVHGFGGDKDHWTRFSAAITDRFHVLAPDLPGFGQSDYLPEESYSYQEQTVRLNDFTSALGLKSFHIVGNSMGGHIAGLYAVHYPAKVETLGLFAAAGVDAPEHSELFDIIISGGNNPLIPKTEADFQRLKRFVFFNPPYIPGFVEQVFVRESLAHQERNREIFQDLHSRPFNLESNLDAIKAPTLVLWGDHDRVLHPSGADVFAKKIKNARKIILKDCGHLPMIERPGQAAEIYLDFLQENRSAQ